MEATPGSGEVSTPGGGMVQIYPANCGGMSYVHELFGMFTIGTIICYDIKRFHISCEKDFLFNFSHLNDT